MSWLHWLCYCLLLAGLGQVRTVLSYLSLTGWHEIHHVWLASILDVGQYLLILLRIFRDRWLIWRRLCTIILLPKFEGCSTVTVFLVEGRVDAINVTKLNTCCVTWMVGGPGLLFNMQLLVGDHDVSLTSSFRGTVCCHLASSVALLVVPNIDGGIVLVMTIHLLQITACHDVSRLIQLGCHCALPVRFSSI